jgi:stage V sporulation protein G
MKKESKNFFDVLTCTNVQVYPFKESGGKTKAYARVAINEQLQLTGIRVVDGANGFFVSYPIDPHYKGEDYHSIYYPLHKELREHIEQCILEKYQETLGNS